MTDTLNQLKAGVRHFRSNVYEQNAEAYRRAASLPQKPHSLIVACADSRVDVEKITNSGPGGRLHHPQHRQHGPGLWRNAGWRLGRESSTPSARLA